MAFTPQRRNDGKGVRVDVADQERYRAYVAANAEPLRRELAAGTEFQVVTLWDSLSSIEAFAGVDVDAAVVPPEVQAMMVNYDRSVAHYEIINVFSTE
jgi:hypothetical protein